MKFTFLGKGKIHFREGHLKTCSVEYNINQVDSFVHLTNYSVQKYCENFSKFEIGNEVSFTDFQVNKNFYSEFPKYQSL
jgi:hypothetical protein